MDRITDLQAFVAIIDKGNLTSAARQLGRSLQSISRSLVAVEDSIGVELIRRTTRRSTPTEAGQALYQRLKLALIGIEEAKFEATHRRVEPSGRLNISGPTGFAAIHLVPAVTEFLKLYPKVEIELNTYDRYVGMTEEDLDIAIQIGPLPDSMLRAKLLANMRRVFFAAPSYFSKHGRPKQPADLKKHQCIVRTSRLGGEVWPYTMKGRIKTLKVSGRFRCSGAGIINEATVHGLGIAIAPFWQVKPLLDKGLVELALMRFEPPTIPVFATWTGTQVLPAKTRLFIDFLAARLKKDRL